MPLDRNHATSAADEPIALALAPERRQDGPSSLIAQFPREASVTRSTLDWRALHVRVREEVAEHGNIEDFHVILWPQEPDASGSNWNGRIGRIRGGKAPDSPW